MKGSADIINTSEVVVKSCPERNPEDQEKDSDKRLWIKKMSGVAACLAHGFFIGPVPVLSRYVEDRGYTPYQILFLFDLLISLVALGITVYQRTNMLPNDWKQGAKLLFQGLTQFTSILCLYTSYRLIPPANAEVVWNAGMPVFVVALSCVFLEEIPTRVTVLGSMWCIAGVALLGYGSFVNMKSSADTADITFGIVLTITGAFIHSMQNVGAKGLLESTPRAKVVTYTYGISTVIAGIGAFITSSTWHLEPVPAAVLVLSCVSHALFVLFLYIALKLVEVNAVTALFQLSAFSAYSVQWAMLGFAPTVLDGLGLTCVLIGTFSIVIWEAFARWKEQKHMTLMRQLDFNAMQRNDNQ
ncbi:solute carrier family 35 member G2-like [Branchiostoma floridae]|uniref:Solute carrier family 35 member G2-like n=1 Tax=Branchiostoma floridae TaxID=7739 RepID=A0A9J7LVZ2_BRAFL|nr:solute carrier family 35 member G2-like [Branchiostoma floridae]